MTIRSILLIVRWSTKNTEQAKKNKLFLNKKEYAVVAELAYAHDSGSCEHYAREGSSPSNCTKRTFSWMFAFFISYYLIIPITVKARNPPSTSSAG